MPRLSKRILYVIWCCVCALSLKLGVGGWIQNIDNIDTSAGIISIDTSVMRVIL